MQQERKHSWYNDLVKKAAVKLTPHQAAEVAVQGMFAKADRDRVERFRREGKLDAAKASL